MSKSSTNTLRPDLELICEWIKPNTRILDLGCGDGALLNHLYKTRNVTGYGLEIDHANTAGPTVDLLKLVGFI